MICQRIIYELFAGRYQGRNLQEFYPTQVCSHMLNGNVSFLNLDLYF